MEHDRNLKSDLFKGFTQDEFVYFVHSFMCPFGIYSSRNRLHPLSVQRCIKIIIMPPSFILKRAVRQEKVF